MTPSPTLNNAQKKRYRTIGHSLNPVVTIAGNGLSEAVLTELQRALEDHELIKVKIHAAERSLKEQLISALCEETGATLVQKIGNIALIYRKARERNERLSNLSRFPG